MCAVIRAEQYYYTKPGESSEALKIDKAGTVPCPGAGTQSVIRKKHKRRISAEFGLRWADMAMCGPTSIDSTICSGRATRCLIVDIERWESYWVRHADRRTRDPT